LLAKMSRSGWVTKRRMRSSNFSNRRAIWRASLPVAVRGAGSGEPGGCQCPVEGLQLVRSGSVQGGFPVMASGGCGVAGLDQQWPPPAGQSC
jgi:hypothetical protein